MKFRALTSSGARRGLVYIRNLVKPFVNVFVPLLGGLRPYGKATSSMYFARTQWQAYTFSYETLAMVYRKSRGSQWFLVGTVYGISIILLSSWAIGSAYASSLLLCLYRHFETVVTVEARLLPQVMIR